MPYELVKLEKRGHVAILTLNRPPMNPLNVAILREMNTAIDEIDADSDVRVLIITGEGDKAFAAGADIKAMQNMTEEQIREFGKTGQEVMRKLENLRMPVIAAVNGYALGGGTELALSCDIIIASKNAKFGQPEVKLGIIPGFGGTQRLPRLIGRNMAKELIFRGNIIDADEALRIGLANHVVEHENLMDEAMKIAEEIASVAPKAVEYAKRSINEGYHKELDDGNAIEYEYFIKSFMTEDRKEGIAAFLEKRKPDFKGQ